MNLRWKIAQYFEAWWWRRYLRGKAVPDYLDWKREYWVDFLQKINLEVPPSATVFDAGCGPAGIFLVLRKNEVTALDPLLGKYRGLFPYFTDGSLRNVRFVEQPLEQFVAPQQFDLVFCLNAINHVADLGVCLQKLREATRPGGKLILSVDAHNHLVFKRLFQLLPGDILHPHQFDLADYKRLLAQYGFQIQHEIRLKKEFFFSYHVLTLKPDNNKTCELGVEMCR
ncbi:MAG: class I SAM-dependent methyltransferase [Bacteroidales bacterium]|nr:class I SAM-dependent methyltransferase [Bacteroidales bacterium]MCF8312240.1 class I SAM-dependent methyltransferase [Saprospiraceae bacterium]MCF8440581.1 class I SAM-dependent methyltransferase [Saprospiraceae bacterium]